ncbi:hypothetical protein [Ekhidna sp.]|uniref:hypothetical protein n=1 Tax=Ekhidna sp. TaxID=2608089 RepID=UPI003C799657
MRITFSLLVFFACSVGIGQSNLQSYTPSILFSEGDWEYKSFQNLYTQTKQFDNAGGKMESGQRETFFTSINQFLFGLNDQINVGLDVWIKASNNSADNFSSSSGLTGIGPKIKIAPFKDIPRLSIQSTFLFNTVDDPEGAEGTRYFLEWDANLWLNQIYFDLPLNEKSQLFFQQAFWYRMTKDGSSADNNFLETQTSVFYSYFPTKRWTIYGMTEYFPTHYDFGNNRSEAFFAYFLQSGVGLKYQLVPNLIELETLYTNFWNGSEFKGAGETINLGIRVIHQK